MFFFPPPPPPLFRTAEIGVFGAPYAVRTWVKAVTMVRKLLLLMRFPQTSVLLPYCLVCNDPNQPAFTFPDGNYPPSMCPYQGEIITNPTGLQTKKKEERREDRKKKERKKERKKKERRREDGQKA